VTVFRAGELDRAGEFAEPEGRVPEELAARELAAGDLAPAEPAAGEPTLGELAAGELESVGPPDGLARDAPEGAGLDGGTDGWLEAAAVGEWLGVGGAVAGPNVATDSMAPATRHTARMLASSGMTVPCPPKGAVSLRSRVRRRWARSSRW
jgi:hypothetical protein